MLTPNRIEKMYKSDKIKPKILDYICCSYFYKSPLQKIIAQTEKKIMKFSSIDHIIRKIFEFEYLKFFILSKRELSLFKFLPGPALEKSEEYCDIHNIGRINNNDFKIINDLVNIQSASQLEEKICAYLTRVCK
jgi:hypothetical protein